jgi:Transglycosylase-like domain
MLWVASSREHQSLRPHAASSIHRRRGQVRPAHAPATRSPRRLRAIRRLAPLATIAVASSALAAPAAADAKKADRHSPNEKKYLKLYDKVTDEHGHDKAGRNIVEDGVLVEKDGKKAKVRTARKGEVVRSIRVFRRILAPAHAHPQAGAKTASSTGSKRGAAASTGGVGGLAGELAKIRACESGGDYGTDTGNGYGGAYQFDQATWQAAGGTGSPASAPPEVQDRVAANWIRKGNRGAWPSC